MIKRNSQLRVLIIRCAAAWLFFLAAFGGESSLSSCTFSGRDVDVIGRKDPTQDTEGAYYSRHKKSRDDIVYNSSFERTNTCDEWVVEDGYLKSPLGEMSESYFSFGEDEWQDYEFSLQACTTKGDCELLIGISCGNNKNYMLILGADDNYTHKLVRVVNNSRTGERESTVIESITGYINPGRGHRIRIRCKGNQLQSWLDKTALFTFTDEDNTMKGRVSIGTRNGQARFRNMKVSALDGNLLFHGLPTRAQDWQAVGRGKVTLDDERPLNRQHSVKLVSNIGDTGIKQDHLVLSKGLWRCTLWMRGETSADAVVCLKEGGKTLLEKNVPVPGSDWRGVLVDFKVDKPVKDAALQIAAHGKGIVWIDQVEFMAEPLPTSGNLAKRH